MRAWSDAEGGVGGGLLQDPTDGNFEAAQHRKIHHVLKTLRLKPGDRLLEFGTAWGGLAIEVRPLLLVSVSASTAFRPLFSRGALAHRLLRRMADTHALRRAEDTRGGADQRMKS